MLKLTRKQRDTLCFGIGDMLIGLTLGEISLEKERIYNGQGIYLGDNLVAKGFGKWKGKKLIIELSFSELSKNEKSTK